MLNDFLGFKGYLDIVLTGPDGEVKQKMTVPNIVTTSGRNYIAHRMTTATNVLMSHMAVGTNSTGGAGIANVALNAEIARVALSSNSVVAPGNVINYIATFPAGTGTGSITEAGILNAAAAGELLCRTTFGTVTKGASDTLQITWTVQNTSS